MFFIFFCLFFSTSVYSSDLSNQINSSESSGFVSYSDNSLSKLDNSLSDNVSHGNRLADETFFRGLNACVLTKVVQKCYIHSPYGLFKVYVDGRPHVGQGFTKHYEKTYYKITPRN